MKLAIMSLMVVCAGCSFFKPWTQSVSIYATDSTAEIYADGRLVGHGVACIPLRRNVEHTLYARAGDRVGVRAVGTEISATGVLDLIGGVTFVVPFIGILAPGFWDLDSTQVLLVIPPADALAQSQKTE